jgi:hypothetical protein
VSTNAAGYNIWMQGATFCWVKNIESGFCNSAHVYMMYCLQCEIRDSYIHDGITTFDGGRAYGVWLSNQSTDCLVENNVLVHLHDSIEIGQGAIGCVIGYNYSDWVKYYVSDNLIEDLSFHGAHCSYNLIEGNYLRRVASDFYYGSHSDNTLFRNRIFGVSSNFTVALNAFTIEWKQHYYSIIGNVLGDTNWPSARYPGVYQRFATDFPYASPPYEYDIYRIGYTDEGEGTAGGVDTNSLTTLIRYANVIVGGSSAVTSAAPTIASLPTAALPMPPDFDIVSGSLGTLTNSITWSGSGLVTNLIAVTNTILPALSASVASNLSGLGLTGLTPYSVALSNSYYLPGKPAWWDTSPWPPIGPDTLNVAGPIPAQNRWLQIVATSSLGPVPGGPNQILQLQSPSGLSNGSGGTNQLQIPSGLHVLSQ